MNYKIIATAKSRNDCHYEIHKKYFAGMVLNSYEAKSLHMKSSCGISAAYVNVKFGIAYAIGIQIHDSEKRNIMLLLRKKEIINISSYMKKGMFCRINNIEKHNNLFKINIAIVKRLKSNDKRIKRKRMDEIDRRVARDMITGVIKLRL